MKPAIRTVKDNCRLAIGFAGKFRKLYTKLGNFRRQRLFMRTGLDLTRHINCSIVPPEENRVLDLFTIAFNNETIIAQQIRLLRLNLEDPFHYTVIDNSSREEKRSLIEKLCAENGVSYIALPANPLQDPSASHGLALNWAYYNYIRPRGAAYWGCIDHDIFPVRKTSILRSLERTQAYGYLETRNEEWYLWPGLCFFSSAITRNAGLDFLPANGRDTGGGNWANLFSKLDRSSIPLMKNEVMRVREGEGDNFQSDYFQLIGDWLHVINGSNWAKTADKDALIESTIRNFETLTKKRWSHAAQKYV
jgi:hypothetical protein